MAPARLLTQDLPARLDGAGIAVVRRTDSRQRTLLALRHPGRRTCPLVSFAWTVTLADSRMNVWR